MLFEEEIPFLYYFGDLLADQKQAAIDSFQTKPNIKVLVSASPNLPDHTPQVYLPPRH